MIVSPPTPPDRQRGAGVDWEIVAEEIRVDTILNLLIMVL
jgi:hypothetical protein